MNYKRLNTLLLQYNWKCWQWKTWQIDKISSWQKSFGEWTLYPIDGLNIGESDKCLNNFLHEQFHIAKRVSVNQSVIFCALNGLVCMMHRFSIDSMIRAGYHKYALIWSNQIVGGELACKCESGNSYDPY